MDCFDDTSHHFPAVGLRASRSGKDSIPPNGSVSTGAAGNRIRVAADTASIIEIESMEKIPCRQSVAVEKSWPRDLAKSAASSIATHAAALDDALATFEALGASSELTILFSGPAHQGPGRRFGEKAPTAFVGLPGDD